MARIAREFTRNAERTRGRSMIATGAGTNHWFHSDTIYRAFLALTTMTGCQGVNGGGWAHYVGQEKVRPLTGFQPLAFAFDWQRRAAVTRLRIPLEYLAELFTAGDTDVVAGVLMKLTALRSYMRARALGEPGHEAVLKAVGLTPRNGEELHRLLAVAKYADRYVVPAAHKEDAAALTAMGNRCPVESPDSGRRRVPLGMPVPRRDNPAGGRP
ncbi:hypothetical protein SVIO_007440 [Streptomyces violaceusniger]|uniref:Respiratory nitrate reductase beta C-terminal domain-containing protein n=1 Tax=Streptomyces violaceusniger TaxID=68280 RepID=A0A4D4KLN5_STRVO|nr:hypothetical protein SVIO_007440 [Streptomyces violaceusniger]